MVVAADDVPSYNMARHFDRAVRFIGEQLARGNVLVHCFAGISRSSTLVLAYLIKEENVPLLRGIEMLRARRPIVCPNIGFFRQLKQFETKELRRKKEPESEESRPGLELVVSKPPTLKKKGVHPNLLNKAELMTPSLSLARNKPTSFSRSGSLNARFQWLR
jgi:hypothetical protein